MDTAYEILIVDDTIYNLFVLEQLIEELDPSIRISKALNGEQALNKIEESKVGNRCSFNLILMDLQMPVMDGF